METEVSVGYLRQFRAQVNIAGYWYGPYGSASTVFGNPQGGAGYWVADWTGHPHGAGRATGARRVRGVSLDTTMAQAAARSAERAARVHVGQCVPCSSARGRAAKMCTEGRRLAVDAAPAPGQGMLPGFIR